MVIRKLRDWVCELSLPVLKSPNSHPKMTAAGHCIAWQMQGACQDGLNPTPNPGLVVLPILPKLLSHHLLFPADENGFHQNGEDDHDDVG